MKTPEDVYLAGYWQSESYFSAIGDVIRREFTVKYEPDSTSNETEERIGKTQSVSIHVRRRDFVENSETKRLHGTCSLDYYSECVTLIGSKVADPHFFVFSDDPDWVTKNLRLKYPCRYVTHNDASRNYEDLRLMSCCKHNIICNSSFSWWGAWLNRNPDKIVLAPRRWFGELNFDTRDLLPASWIKV